MKKKSISNDEERKKGVATTTWEEGRGGTDRADGLFTLTFVEQHTLHTKPFGIISANEMICPKHNNRPDMWTRYLDVTELASLKATRSVTTVQL